MGTVTATIEVGDPQGENFQEVQLEVDTGSTYTALPREMLQALGVPVNRSVQSRLADGSRQTVEIGQTTIRLAGNQFITTVIFAGEGEPSLLGVITLGRRPAGRGPSEQQADTGRSQAILDRFNPRTAETDQRRPTTAQRGERMFNRPPEQPASRKPGTPEKRKAPQTR